MDATVATLDSPGSLRITPADRERIQSALENSRSPHTRRAYASQWRLWQSWAKGRGVSALPADPEMVAAYLAQRAEQSKVPTLRLIRAAIAAAHKEAGRADPTAHAGVKRVLSGLARGNGSVDQAAPLTAEALEAIRAAAPLRRNTRRAAVDVALCSLMRDGLLRRSEAAALRWGDILSAEDGSGRLTLHCSKTDPEGEGCVLYVGQAAMRDLAAVRKAGAQPQDSVFGLSASQISRRIRDAAAAAGLTGQFSGHSPRIGMAQDLAAEDTELPALMTAGRWKSPGMPARYTRSQAVRKGAVARFYRRA